MNEKNAMRGYMVVSVETTQWCTKSSPYVSSILAILDVTLTDRSWTRSARPDDGRVCPSREQSGQAFPASSRVLRRRDRQTSTQSEAPSAGSREQLNSIYKRLFARTLLSEPCLTSRRSNGNYVLSRHFSTWVSLFYQNRKTTTKRPIKWVLQIVL